MKIMDSLQWNEVNGENRNFFKAIGVDCVLIVVPPEMAEGTDPTEEFRRLKAFVESHALELFCLHCGWLPRDKIVYGLPGRERQLENWCKVVRALGSVGVPATATTFFAISHFRTQPAVGRGGAAYSVFDYEELVKDPPRYPGKEITEDRLWENISWFLERVIPEAQRKVTLQPAPVQSMVTPWPSRTKST